MSTALSRNDNTRSVSRGSCPRPTPRRPRQPTRKQSFGASTRKKWLSCESKIPSSNTGPGENVQSQPESDTTAPGPPTNAENRTKTRAARKVDEGAKLNSEADRNLKLVDEFWDKYAEEKLSSPPYVSSRRRLDRSRALVRHVVHKVRPGRKMQRNIDLVSQGKTLNSHTLNSKLYPLYRKAVLLLETVEHRSRGRTGFPKSNLYTVSYVNNPALQRREIYVPDETIAFLAGVSIKFSQSENVWFMGLHGDCRVHVLPTSESLGVNRKVVLIGFPRAVTSAMKSIMTVKERQEKGDPLVDIQKPPVPIFPSRLSLAKEGPTEGSWSLTKIRGVWAHDPRPSVALDALIDSPHKISTVRQFMEHVEQLTRSEPTPGHSTPHRTRVAGALRYLFLDRNMQHLISTTAVNVAISYLLKQKYRDIVRALFNRVGHVATIETFNILLKSVAKTQNIESFCSILAVMARLRVAPDIRTWLALLDSLILPTQKAYLVKLMERRGYLKDPYILRSVLQFMVKDLFKEHLRAGGSVNDFFQRTVMVSGSNWFPPSLTKQMFAVTANLGNVRAMRKLLKLCKGSQVPLDSTVAYEIINLFPNDTYSAVYYVLQCLDSSSPDLDSLTYERLFVNAFHNKHYNICRVLWRYACMNESTTKPMRDTMTFLLMQNKATESMSEQEKLWWTSAGKVIAGVCLHRPEYPLKQDLLKSIPSEFHDSPLSAFVNRATLEGKEREDQRRAARAIIKHDYEVGPWFRPILSIGPMLEAALQLDTDWGSVPRPTNWLIQNAIYIRFSLSLSRRKKHQK
ncbi:uncharacterized protein DSM5745_03082 [Aspergillus mulundensis]|uniref:Uncharacterized protein n=1 Tax=Aspergillus mulundensis TaxID=1810919 RepID=A0A3D8SJD1_9EURO|nr:Uncharacterized protein DSM5745_03082 [Aspergillus mulundensis]RDW86440.1 Uncharacterized protein DSM5745_03082 [Aspergillus mulundensis]